VGQARTGSQPAMTKTVDAPPEVSPDVAGEDIAVNSVGSELTTSGWSLPTHRPARLGGDNGRSVHRWINSKDA